MIIDRQSFRSGTFRLQHMLGMLAIMLGVFGGQSVALAQFGQNKVQYQTFNWKYISTEHFDIYFDEPLLYLAEFCAHKAEGAFDGICSDLNYRVNKRITILVYGSHVEYQQTNVIPEFMPEGIRGVTEIFKNRVVVNFEGNWEHFRQLLHHELTHALLNEMLYNGNTRNFLQSKVQFPLWMNEGLAEFESMHGMDAETDMFLRDITLSENLPPLERLGGYFAYRGGQAFWDYVVRKYGRGKIAEVLFAVRMGMDLNSVFANAFSMTFEEFSERWQDDVKREYFPDLASFTRLDDFAKRLSNHIRDDSHYNSSPAVSPDGSKVAFISYRDGAYGIYVMEVEKKTEIRKLVSSQRTLDFEELNVWTPGISWSPSGDRLAISAKSGGEDALYIVDSRSGDYTKLRLGLKSIASVAWAPDGKSIAMSATKYEQTDLYLYTLASKQLTKVTDDVFSDEHPCWSPDGASLFFVSDRGAELASSLKKDSVLMWRRNIRQSDIYRIALSSHTIERITQDPDNNKSSLSISRDAETILYVSDESGIGNVYAQNLKSLERYPVTNSLSGIGQIALTKDDSRLFFSALSKGSLDVFYIKRPFDLKADSLVLPRTRLKLRQNVQSSFSQSRLPDPERAIERRLIGYGHVDVETRRQHSEEMLDTLSQSERRRAERRYDSIPDHFTVHDYRVNFSNDIITGGVGYNSLWNNGQGNIDMLFSDVLGNHVVYTSFNLWTDLKNSNVSFSYRYQPEIIDYTLSAYHKAFLTYFEDPRFGLDLYSMRTYGVNLGAEYAWSRFQRVEAGLGWIGVTKFNESTPELYPTNTSDDFLVPSLRWVFDNSQWGFFAPYRGTRAYADLKISPITKRFALFNFDVREYLPIWKEYYGIALRAAGGASFGPEPHNFFLGGVENWIGRGNFGFGYDIFSHAEDFAFLQTQTPLRGFEIGQLAGTKYAMANVEFRFPFFSGFVAIPMPFVLLGSVFMDVGTAWNGPMSQIGMRNPIDTIDSWGYRKYYTPSSVLLSTGVGLRTVLLGLPMKVDFAWRREGDHWSDVNYIFSLGYDL